VAYIPLSERTPERRRHLRARRHSEQVAIDRSVRDVSIEEKTAAARLVAKNVPPDDVSLVLAVLGLHEFDVVEP